MVCGVGTEVSVAGSKSVAAKPTKAWEADVDAVFRSVESWSGCR